ncbi:MAG: hypothetical protein ACOCQB_01125 [Halanaerobiaceae bacterium]
MRQLADSEIISLTGLLKMERDGLAAARAMKSLISDENLRQQADTAIMAAEGRIKGMQQFINENQISSERVT